MPDRPRAVRHRAHPGGDRRLTRGDARRVTVVPAGQSPRRLDIFVSTQNAHVSRALAQRWIESGVITVNGEPSKPARRIRAGDVIVSHVPVRPLPDVLPEPISLEMLHEADHILIVNKPPGLVMHPAP